MSIESEFTEEHAESLRGKLYQALRQATHDEIYMFAQGFMVPMVQKIDALSERMTEIEKSLGLLLDGQALIEKHLAGSFEDEEPWQESLDD